MLKFLKECRQELNKVIWPSREEVANSTIVVLVGVVIISIFLFTSESIFEKIFDTLVSYKVPEEREEHTEKNKVEQDPIDTSHSTFKDATSSSKTERGN